MKRTFTAAIILTMIIVFSGLGYADLYNRGTDSRGNQLIYDSDLNITWYDYTNDADTWQNQLDWAGALTVNFGGTIFDDWRLPLTVDGPYVDPFDYTGTTTAGYNITTSEWGHLYYVELGNVGIYDTSGNETGWPMTVTNTGDFLNWQTSCCRYWSGTEYATDPSQAWNFLPDVGSGRQGTSSKTLANYYAMAVRSGDVAATVVPEPISSFLFVTGGTLLAGRRYIKRKKAA